MADAIPPVLDKAALPIAPRQTEDVVAKRAKITQVKRDLWAGSCLVLGFVVVCLSLMSSFYALHVVSVSHTIKLNGTLQAIDQSIPIKHETGGIVSNVFVTEGEIVREGQILISFGTEDLTVSYNDAQKNVARLLVELRCAKATLEKAVTFSLPQDLKSAFGRLDQVEAFRRATRQCETQLQTQSYERERYHSKLNLAQDRLHLYERLAQTDYELRQRLTQVELPQSVKDLKSIESLEGLRTTLRHSLNAATAKAELAELKRMHEQREHRDRATIINRIDAISDELIGAELQLARIENIRENRFLYASTSGRVQRLRIKKTGGRVAAGAYVLEIAPLTTDFEVLATIGLADAPDVNIGHAVDVKLSGGMPRPVWVPAHIQNITKLSANKRLVSIRLRREDLNKRDLLWGDFSLNGLGEQSEALISISSENAASSLAKILSNQFFERDEHEV